MTYPDGRSDSDSILVVFDLDGTLYHSETSFFPAVETFLKAHNVTDKSDVRLEKFIGEPMHVFIEWIESLGIDADVKELVREFDALEIEAVNRLGKLYPSVKPVLEELIQRGAVLGICSNGQAPYIETVLERFGIRPYISTIKYPISRTDTKSVMLSEIKKQFSPEKAFMVGDRIHDFQGARDVGFLSIGVSYGYGGDEIEQADYVIDRLPELVNIVFD